MKTLVVVLDESQNANVHEQFIKGLPLGSSVIFDDGNPNDQMRVFDKESSPSWNPPHVSEYNWLFLRQQQNWANDILRARGHVFLNEIYSTLGFKHTKAGALLGWIVDTDARTKYDMHVDFGCWEHDNAPNAPKEQEDREGAIKLQFNAVPILHLIDAV